MKPDLEKSGFFNQLKIKKETGVYMENKENQNLEPCLDSELLGLFRRHEKQPKVSKAKLLALQEAMKLEFASRLDQEINSLSGEKIKEFLDSLSNDEFEAILFNASEELKNKIVSLSGSEETSEESKTLDKSLWVENYEIKEKYCLKPLKENEERDLEEAVLWLTNKLCFKGNPTIKEAKEIVEGLGIETSDPIKFISEAILYRLNEMLFTDYNIIDNIKLDYNAETIVDFTKILKLKAFTYLVISIKNHIENPSLAKRASLWQALEGKMHSVEVRLEGLTKVFTDKQGRETVAVNDFNVSIPAGKLVGLLGPSGCGKSTTLFMIAGLHNPTSGKIYFDEEDVTIMPPEKRGIGLVFQNYALYPHMTVKQNILFPLENMKVPKEKALEMAKKMAELVHIGDLLDRKPQQLSGGQQQRVAIARALVKKPRVLLLDEPLSNLDARLRLQMREEIRRIQHSTGITTIFVTHDQEEAMSISDKIVLMNYGVHQQEDEPQNVYDNPKNLFVAKFLGNPPINIQAGYILGKKLYLNNGTLLTNADAEDQEVFIGLRPEFFVIDEKGPMKAGIKYIEHIGRDTMAICDFENFDKVADRKTLKALELEEQKQSEETVSEEPKDPKAKTPKMVTVSFAVEGGSPVPSITVPVGTQIEEPKILPRRPGYSFRAWTLNGKDFNFIKPIKENITLTAQWEKGTIRVIVAEGRQLSVGQKISLGFKKLYVFSQKTGERVL